MKLEDHPVTHIEWVDVDRLVANSWNPNMVASPEMRLLKHSILKQGWVQPILVAKGAGESLLIIDGFHRATLAKTDKAVVALTGGKVPVCILDLSEPDRMMLTVRINRAKGSHVAFKMHDMVTRLINEHGLTIQQVGEGIGADKSEIELLLTENVFKKLDIENTPYSRAWMPNE